MELGDTSQATPSSQKMCALLIGGIATTATGARPKE